MGPLVRQKLPDFACTKLSNICRAVPIWVLADNHRQIMDVQKVKGKFGQFLKHEAAAGIFVMAAAALALLVDNSPLSSR